jgi:hypothetical protein
VSRAPPLPPVPYVGDHNRTLKESWPGRMCPMSRTVTNALKRLIYPTKRVAHRAVVFEHAHVQTPTVLPFVAGRAHARLSLTRRPCLSIDRRADRSRQAPGPHAGADRRPPDLHPRASSPSSPAAHTGPPLGALRRGPPPAGAVTAGGTQARGRERELRDLHVRGQGEGFGAGRRVSLYRVLEAESGGDSVPFIGSVDSSI